MREYSLLVEQAKRRLSQQRAEPWPPSSPSAASQASREREPSWMDVSDQGSSEGMLYQNSNGSWYAPPSPCPEPAPSPVSSGEVDQCLASMADDEDRAQREEVEERMAEEMAFQRSPPRQVSGKGRGKDLKTRLGEAREEVEEAEQALKREQEEAGRWDKIVAFRSTVVARAERRAALTGAFSAWSVAMAQQAEAEQRRREQKANIQRYTPRIDRDI